eukprot:s434_g11.t1
MPKKLYKDGPKADKDDIKAVIAAWHGEAELLNTSIEKKHLVQDHKGDSVVKICLPNAARNYVLLMHVATNMLKRKRLSADPVDVLTLIFVGWYTKVQEAYKTCEAFDAKAWAFKDGWVVHKLLTLFRIKAIRGEEQGGGSAVEQHEPELESDGDNDDGGSEAAEPGDDGDEAMLDAAAEPVHAADEPKLGAAAKPGHAADEPKLGAAAELGHAADEPKLGAAAELGHAADELKLGAAAELGHAADEPKLGAAAELGHAADEPKLGAAAELGHAVVADAYLDGAQMEAHLADVDDKDLAAMISSFDDDVDVDGAQDSLVSTISTIKDYKLAFTTEEVEQKMEKAYENISRGSNNAPPTPEQLDPGSSQAEVDPVPPASKDEQLRLVQDARAESKKGQGKGKPKAKAKGKAKAKASAKSKAKAVAKKQPKAKGSMKRPAAAAFVGEALTDDPVEEEKPEEHECEDPEPLPLNDVVPDAASLPNTFARRGKPTSAKGLVKYGRIVEAFEQHIVPTVQGRKMCDAQDPIRPKYSFACSKHQLTTFDILVLIVCCFLYLKPLLSEASMHPCAVPVLRPRAAEHAPLA